MTVALIVPTALWLVAALGDSLHRSGWLSAHTGARLVAVAIEGAQILIGALRALGVAMLVTFALGFLAVLLR